MSHIPRRCRYATGAAATGLRPRKYILLREAGLQLPCSGVQVELGRLRVADIVRILRAVEVEMLQVRQGAQSVDIARPVLVS